MTDKKIADKDPEYFMQEAAKTVSQRGTDNGYDAGQERSAAAVAEMFNSMYPGYDLIEEHIWAIMLSVKLVRNARKPREDNIVDLIGYAGLLGESQSAPKKVKPSLHEKRGPSMAAREKSDIKGIFLVPRFEGIDAAPYKVADDYPHNVAETHDSFLFDGLYFLKSRWTLKEYK